MSHTPGPWKVSKAVFDEETGEVGYFFHGVTEVRATDRWLIEAAPKMLEMLLELRECAEYWSEYDVPLGVVKRLDETIRKARGEE
jgi:hypothetical protein